MVEIEKKYRLTEERACAIAEELEGSSAVFEGEDVEENTIYGGEILHGGVVRIRRIGTHTLLTFKRRLPDLSDVKHQTEHETEVSDADSADRILRELQLAPSLVYEKRRRTWRFRSVKITIDELPFGLFMEIEGSLTGIREAEMLLDLDDLETEHETYPGLTARLGRRVGEVIESRFS
jgi:adenylate cyclase class 2